MFDISEVQFGEHSLQFLYVHNIFHLPMGIHLYINTFVFNPLFRMSLR